tara:strand:- start:8560 stop:8805 length:246 start_codon:yes stop_codon:yes gene_type:complete
MTQQNEVREPTKEELMDELDTVNSVLNIKESRITQLEKDLVKVSKAGNKRIGELVQQLEDKEKDFDLAELNGKGELAEVTS